MHMPLCDAAGYLMPPPIVLPRAAIGPVLKLAIDPLGLFTLAMMVGANGGFGTFVIFAVGLGAGNPVLRKECYT